MNWRDDLERAVGTDLGELLSQAPGPDFDNAALGVGILAWTARSRHLLQPGGVLPLLVRITDGQAAELELPPLCFDGKQFGPSALMLCPAGEMPEMLPWAEAVASAPADAPSGFWLRDWDKGKPTGEVSPADILADHADLLRFDHVSLGACLHAMMSAVADLQGSRSALVVAVSMTDMLSQALGQNAGQIQWNAAGVTVKGRPMGDWGLSCAPLSSTELTRRDEVEVDTSTPEGAAQVRRLMNGDGPISGLTVRYVKGEPVQMSVRTPR